MSGKNHRVKNKKSSNKKEAVAPITEVQGEVRVEELKEEVKGTASNKRAPDHMQGMKFMFVPLIFCLGLLLGFWLTPRPDVAAEYGIKQSGGVASKSDSEDAVKPADTPAATPAKETKEDTKPADSSKELDSFGVKLSEPTHAEGIMVYDTHFPDITNNLLEAYRGLDIYNDMYSFSVGVHDYTSTVKDLVTKRGLFPSLNEGTDNASYIVTQGVNEAGNISYQLYLAVDGTQEVSVSYNVGRATIENDSDKTWADVANVMQEYVGAAMSKDALASMATKLKAEGHEGGAFTLLLSDETARTNIQMSASALGESEETWNITGVHLVQDSLATEETEEETVVASLEEPSNASSSEQ